MSMNAAATRLARFATTTSAGNTTGAIMCSCRLRKISRITTISTARIRTSARLRYDEWGLASPCLVGTATNGLAGLPSFNDQSPTSALLPTGRATARWSPKTATAAPASISSGLPSPRTGEDTASHSPRMPGFDGGDVRHTRHRRPPPPGSRTSPANNMSLPPAMAKAAAGASGSLSTSFVCHWSSILHDEKISSDLASCCHTSICWFSRAHNQTRAAVAKSGAASKPGRQLKPS